MTSGGLFQKGSKLLGRLRRGAGSLSQVKTMVRPAMRLAVHAVRKAADRYDASSLESPVAADTGAPPDMPLEQAKGWLAEPFPADWPRQSWSKFHIERVNGAELNLFGGSAIIAAHPRGLLRFQGWVYDPVLEVQGGALRLLVDGIPYRAYLGDFRDDVAHALQAPLARFCGFQADVPVHSLRSGEHQLVLEYVSSGRREVLQSSTGTFTLHLDAKLPSADEEVHGVWGRDMVIRRSAVGVAGLEAEGRLDQRSTRDAFRAMNMLYLLLKSSPYSSPWPTHVSDEQWYPLIYKAFQASGLPIEEYECDPEGFERYLEFSKPLYAKHGYINHYGGERGYFLEKAFEHYISWEYLRWGESDRVMDLACWTSPASEVLSSFNRADFYAHDITLKTDLKKKAISGYAHAIEAPDSYFDAVTAHCAIDNFEGTADIDVFHEAARILKPGGRILIAPLHVAVRAENVIGLGYPGVELDEGAHLVLGNPGTMRFGRHYSADSLRKRLVQNVPELSFRVVHVRNLPTQAHPPTATCRFLLVGTRPS